MIMLIRVTLWCDAECTQRDDTVHSSNSIYTPVLDVPEGSSAKVNIMLH
jgi:hypothetical protein